MLLSLLYRSTLHEAPRGVSYFSVVVVGMLPRLLVDCANVTRDNITKALTSLAAHLHEVPSVLHSQPSLHSRPMSDLDFVMSICLSIAQSRPYKPGVIMITECNISSSTGQVHLFSCHNSICLLSPVSQFLTSPSSPCLLQP